MLPVDLPPLLHEVVDGRSAEDGEVEFIVPSAPQSLVLWMHRETRSELSGCRSYTSAIADA